MARELTHLAACVIVSPFSLAPEALPGGTHFIVDNVRLTPLSDEHKARLVDYLDTVQEDILSRFVRTRPAFIVPYSEVSFLKGVGNPGDRNALALQLHRFAIEYFAGRPVPMAAFSFDGTNVTGHSVDPDGLRFREADLVQLPAPAWDKQAAYLQFLYPHISHAPAADIVIGRVCRAFREGPGLDGIIDLAIALESLVEAKLEIKFQFCLFNALVNSDACDDRQTTFSLLQALYDIRSSAVHGSKLSKSGKQKQKEIIDNWNQLLEVARTNLTYYVEFCRQHASASWSDHLRTLAFGGSRMQVDN